MDRRLKRWELALLLGLLWAVLAGMWLAREQRELADRMVRLHVVAHSDSPRDQALKLAVRDPRAPMWSWTLWRSTTP